VFDGRPELLEDIKHSDQALTNELSKRFKGLLRNYRFIDAIPGHLPPDETGQARAAIVIKILKKIVDLK